MTIFDLKLFMFRSELGYAFQYLAEVKANRPGASSSQNRTI